MSLSVSRCLFPVSLSVCLSHLPVFVYARCLFFFCLFPPLCLVYISTCLFVFLAIYVTPMYPLFLLFSVTPNPVLASFPLLSNVFLFSQFSHSLTLINYPPPPLSLFPSSLIFSLLYPHHYVLLSSSSLIFFFPSCPHKQYLSLFPSYPVLIYLFPSPFTHHQLCLSSTAFPPIST